MTAIKVMFYGFVAHILSGVSLGFGTASMVFADLCEKANSRLHYPPTTAPKDQTVIVKAGPTRKTGLN